MLIRESLNHTARVHGYPGIDLCSKEQFMEYYNNDLLCGLRERNSETLIFVLSMSPGIWIRITDEDHCNNVFCKFKIHTLNHRLQHLCKSIILYKTMFFMKLAECVRFNWRASLLFKYIKMAVQLAYYLNILNSLLRTLQSHLKLL